MEELAALVAMSPFHFNRIFKEITKESLHAYIKRVKLEHAANLLLFNPDATITHIMHDVDLFQMLRLHKRLKKTLRNAHKMARSGQSE